MQKEQLEQFVKIAHCKSIDEASERTGLSKARIGALISLLEEELGHSLFHKKAKGLELTGYGRALLDRSPHIILELRRLEEALEEEQKRLSVSVYFGFFSTTHCFLLMPQVASAFPDKLFTASVQASHNIIDDMQREHVHVGVMPTASAPQECVKVPLMTEQAYLSVPFTSSLAGKESITLADVVKEPIYMVSDIYGLSQWYESIYAKAGGDLSRAQRPAADEYLKDSNSTPRNHFSSNVMQTFGNSGAQRIEVPIDDPIARRDIALVYLPKDEKRVRSVVDYIVKNVKTLYSSHAFLPYLLHPGTQDNLTYIEIGGENTQA